MIIISAKWFVCPDGAKIEIADCLKEGGCRMGQRCATRPYLRLVSFDREWNGVSPSSAGNGPRYLYLKATTDYAIDPQDRVWAAFGTSTHEKLSIHKYTYNVLSEEKLSDNEMFGIADVLEQDEYNCGKYAIFDYKTWGSYKVGKAMGVTAIKEEVIDNEGKLVLLRSGKNKGKPKTIKSFKTEPKNIDLTNETLQLNRYRIMFEKYGFPISKMQIQAVVRDGGTYIAQSRGIERNLYLLDVPRMSNSACLKFYHGLQIEVDKAFKDKWIRKCNSQESWEGRRCKGFCEVTEACNKMGD